MSEPGDDVRTGRQSAVSRRGLIVGLVMALGFPLALFGVSRLLNLTTRNALTSTSSNYLQAAVDAVVLVVVVVVLTAARLQWRAVLRDERRRRSVVVALLLALWVVGIVAQFFVPYPSGAASFVMSLLVLVVLVAAVEETVYRGILVAGLRWSAPEWVVWLVSTVLFTLAHLGSAVLGDNPGQLRMVFVLGSACYAARRITGSLAGAVVVHVLYDFSIGLRTQAEAAAPVPLVLATGLILIALAVAGVVLALRKDR